MPNCIMPPAIGRRFVDFDGVAQPGEMIGGRQSARPGADHQHPPAARRGLDLNVQPSCAARSPRKRSTAWMPTGAVQLAAIAGAFARMVADPAVHRRHRVVPHQRLPRLAILPGLRQPQPRLDVLARRAGVVAGRQQIDIDRMGGARRPGLAPVGHVDQRAHVADAVVHVGAFAVWSHRRRRAARAAGLTQEASQHDRQHDARDAEGTGVLEHGDGQLAAAGEVVQQPAIGRREQRAEGEDEEVDRAGGAAFTLSGLTSLMIE